MATDIIKYYQYVPLKEYFNPAKITTSDREYLMKLYLDNIKMAKENDMNTVTIDYESNLRIMSWNVRYFTDINDNLSIDKIAEVINKFKPDILCVQEATVGYDKYYPLDTPYPIDIRQYLPDYKLLSSCFVVPSWYEANYGNMIFIKRAFGDNIYENSNFSEAFGRLCKQGLTQGTCLFNQYATTYTHPKPELELTNQQKINVFTDETRCYIKISLTFFDLICTHLEAYKQRLRMKQLEEINQQITRPTIILGDFNIVDVNVYRRLLKSDNFSEEVKKKIEIEWKYMREYHGLTLEKDTDLNDIDYITDKLRWIDVYTLLNKPKHVISNWAGTVVDYMFVSSHWKTIKDTTILKNIFTQFEPYSDHLPLICDIYDKEINNMSVRKKTLSRIMSDKTVGVKEFSKQEFEKTYNVTLFYNSQPLLEYDWFDLTTKNVNIGRKKFFRDPYHTGNFKAVYGLDGIYFFREIFNTLSYKKSFQEVAMKDTYAKSMKNSGMEYSGTTFVFRIKNDVNIAYLEGMDLISNMMKNKASGNNVSAFASIADIIGLDPGLLSIRKFDSLTGKHALFDLNNVYISITYSFSSLTIDVNTIVDMDCKSFPDCDIIVPGLNKIVSDGVRYYHPDKNDIIGEKIVRILINSLEYINRLNVHRYGNQLMTSIAGIDKCIEIDNETVKFDLLKYVGTYIKKGGYYDKYRKYKSKYLLLKNSQL